jgi:hypothetical protein
MSPHEDIDRIAKFNLQVIENLKFSECLSPELAALVFNSRFDDSMAVINRSLNPEG